MMSTPSHRYWVSEYNPTKQGFRTQVCRHFKRGNCQRGFYCNFIHSGQVRPRRRHEVQMIMEVTHGNEVWPLRPKKTTLPIL
jgi:hypothetical protein